MYDNNNSLTGLCWACPKCGSLNRHIDSNGHYVCSNCGYNESSAAAPYTPNQYFGKTGWICPNCGRGVSPFTDVCPCTGYYNTITYSTNNTESK